MIPSSPSHAGEIPIVEKVYVSSNQRIVMEKRKKRKWMYFRGYIRLQLRLIKAKRREKNARERIRKTDFE